VLGDLVSSYLAPLSRLRERGRGRGAFRTMSALDHAKKLRKRQTDAELRLWYYLRARRFLDAKFKRQKPIGPYIADFVCFERHLVIELDGSQHFEQAEYDRVREQWMATGGYRTLRFWNHDVLTDTPAVLERIRQALQEEAPFPPALLP
jgi:very-short-patch-repair endonuclease